MRRPAWRTKQGEVSRETNDVTLPKRTPPCTRSRIPRLIVHLDRPPRVDVIADDHEQAIAAQRVARVVAWLLERLARAA